MNNPQEPYLVVISEEMSSPPASDQGISYLYLPDLWKNREYLFHRIGNADGLIVRNQTRVDKDLIKSAEGLRVIGRLGAGLDNIDLDAAHKAGIQIVNAPTANTISVAEFCLACIFFILRNLPQAIRSTSSGEWARKAFSGRELEEIVIGLVGFGRIAEALAARLDLLGGKLLIHTRSPEKVPSRYVVAPFPALLRGADIVSVHVPGGLETRYLFGPEQFKMMKSTAWLINTSRGSVVEEKALYQALLSGDIAGALVDVREKEPPAVGKLEELPNFIPTPHIAAFTSGAQSRVNQGVLEDVAAVLRGGAPKGVVKRE